jgi:hypothetical protein
MQKNVTATDEFIEEQVKVIGQQMKMEKSVYSTG